MQNISEKEVIFRAYQIEKDLYQQSLVAKTIQNEIDALRRDERILQKINNGEGYTTGTDWDHEQCIQELSWSYFEKDSPYKRMEAEYVQPQFWEVLTEVYEKFFWGVFYSGFVTIFFIWAIAMQVKNRYASESIFEGLFGGIKMLFPVGMASLVVSAVICFFVTIYKFCNEKNWCKKVNSEACKNNELIAQHNEQCYKERLTVAENLKREYNYITQTLMVQTEENRKKIYSLGVIDDDYQNIIAVSSFYQYFRSGRVDSLSGVFGAYNKYEKERRQDAIITELKAILSSLEQIKQNQRVLYDAIKEGQNTGHIIVQEIHKMQGKLDILNDNTCITRYNAQNIADNIEFLKWYELLKS